MINTRTDNTASRALSALFLAVALAVLSGCEPSDRTPGLWLRGETVAVPADWSFTDGYREIFVEVTTPWRMPHSVTIWCGQVDGDLYIGARDPATKKWPGWVADEPNVRLKIGEDIYEVVLQQLDDADTLTAVRAAYAAKYDLPAAPAGKPRNVRYWAVRPRA